MSEAFVELLFWIVVFLVFFFGFKRLQKRKEERRAQANSGQTGRGVREPKPQGDPSSGIDSE